MAGARWHRRLFRVLLRGFPAEFRERFAAEMVGDFQEQLDEARSRGARRLIGLWLRTGRDLLRQAPAEHLDILRRDLVLAARSCRRHPTLALTIVLTLAVAVGLNTAVFSVVDGVLLRQLPFDREDRLVALHELRPGPDRQRRGVSPVNFADWTSRVTTLEAMTLVRMSEITLPGDEYPVRVQVMAVSDDFFRLFPAAPALGRLLHRGDYEAPVSAGERSAPGHAALVLSHTLWQQHFGGRADAIGGILHLNAGRAAEIVGVLPPDFPYTLAWMEAGRTKGQLEAALLERIRTLPSVVAAGIGSRPLGGSGLGITVRLPQSPDEPVVHPVDVVSPGYLEALGARLVQGRFFAPQDESSRSRMAIVNEAAARAGWAAGAALGDRVVIDDEPVDVIGVIGDVRRHALEEAPAPTLYLLSGQWPGFWTNNVLVRTRGDPLAVLPSARAIMRDVDPTQALARIHTLDDALAAARAPRRFTFWLIGLFSAIALGLAGMGVYSLAAESVSQRLPEIGVRVTLGATPIRIVRLVVIQGATLSVTGITVGLLGAATLNRTMEGLIFGVETTDVLAHGAATLVLTLATLGACVQPARRAVHVDPVTALRTE